MLARIRFAPQTPMRSLLLGLILLTIPLVSSAGGAPIVVCDKNAIRQAIEISRQEVHQTDYQLNPRQGLRKTSLRPDLLAIEAVEKNVFGKQIFNLSYDFVAGASIRENDIAIYSETIKVLNSLAPGSEQNSSQAHLFVMAHEIGHMVQEHWKKHNASGLSVSGLPNSSSHNDDSFNLLHAETDCIAIELMRMAGQKDFSQVLESIHLVSEDCKQFRSEEFCNRADATRSGSVQRYLEQ